MSEAELWREIKRLQNTIDAMQTQETPKLLTSWIAPSLQNSWVNYGFQFQPSGYLLDPLGFVHLKGLVKDGTTSTTIFTLPAGYRPAEEIIYISVMNGTSGELRVTTAGAVNHVYGSNAYVSLAIPPFRAA